MPITTHHTSEPGDGEARACKQLWAAVLASAFRDIGSDAQDDDFILGVTPARREHLAMICAFLDLHPDAVREKYRRAIEDPQAFRVGLQTRGRPRAAKRKPLLP